MKILIEEYQYDAALVRDVLYGIDALQNVEGKVSLSYVGYFYNPKLNDTVFILPKVLMDESGKVFGNKTPESLIHPHTSGLNDQERAFLYEFAVWIYRAVDVYQHSHPESDIVYHRKLSQVGRGMRKRTNTLLDILLSLIQFNKDNRSYITLVLKNIHSGYNKINWTRTISHSQAIVQDDSPIYLNPVNKKRKVNFDEELLIIYYSILNYISDTYGFHVDIMMGFPLIKGAQFENYLNGRGVVRLRQIKCKYFSDKSLELWNLCYAFFAHRTEITTSAELKEYLLVKNFYVVFEAIIDELIGDSKEELPADFKEQKDGKLVDHLYTYPGLIEADEEQKTYYIGDSKYYKIGGQLGDTSIYKQYTYARNIVQYNIDLWMDLKEGDKKPDVRLRDDVTEGYNVIPNFFISAAMEKDDYSYNHREIKLTKVSGKRNPEIKFQFKDRLFDRDTMLLSRYNVNFLFVVSLYARNRQSEKAEWKNEVRNQFRERIRQVLAEEYSFFPMRSRGVVLDDYMTEHFRQLNGKVFTPFQDREILTLALHTPNKVLTQEQAGLIEMMKADFDIDEHYKLGDEPQLPPATNLQFSTNDYVLVGYYKDEGHLKWILEKHLYNVRAGKDRGTLDLTPSVCAARYFLLYGKDGVCKFRLKPGGVHVWSKDELAKSGYPTNPRHDYYLVFSIEESITSGDFAKMSFDREKFKALLNKFGKDHAGHDKGAVAVPFSELVSCKA